MKEKYDIIIIGSGPAGYSAAIKAAGNGKSTLIIDKKMDLVGGVCLNKGCIPTKALLHHSHLFSSMKNSTELGFHCEVKGFDMNRIQRNITTVKTRLRDGIFFLFKKHGIDFLEGSASIEKKGLVFNDTSIGKKEIATEDIIIACGSHPKEIEGLPFNGNDIISSSDALTLTEIPKKFLIIGGGSIGIEFAEIFHDFNCDVTIVELEKSLLPREDADIGKHMAMYLKKKGIPVLTSSKVVKAEKTENGYDATIDTPTGEKNLFYNKILVAVGREPNEVPCSSPKLIQYRDGFIPSDSATKEYSNNIYAIGDVSPGPMLAHKAYLDADIAVGAILGKQMNVLDTNWIPRITYSHTEAASIGLTESELKEKRIEYKTAKQFFKANGRAAATGEDTGLIKILTSIEDGSLLGAHLFGPSASELIHIFLISYSNKIKPQNLGHLPFAHPTYSELIKETVRLL